MMSKAGEASAIDNTESLQDERSAEKRRRRAAILAQDQQSSSEEEDETSDSNRSEEEDSEEEEEEDSVGRPSHSQAKPSGAHIPAPQPSQGRTNLLAPTSAATSAPLAAQHQAAAQNLQANASRPNPATVHPATTSSSHAAVPPAQPHMVPSSQSSSHATSSSAPTSSMDTSARASQNQANVASSPAAAKHRRWNPFARKDPSPRDLDAKIQHYQQRAEDELNKSDTAEGRLRHNNSVVHDSHAPIGSRISHFFQKFNNWTSQKTHKRSHNSLQNKVSKLQTKRRQQNTASSRPH